MNALFFLAWFTPNLRVRVKKHVESYFYLLLVPCRQVFLPVRPSPSLDHPASIEILLLPSWMPSYLLNVNFKFAPIYYVPSLPERIIS